MRNWKTIEGIIFMIGMSIFNAVVCTTVDNVIDKKKKNRA